MFFVKIVWASVWNLIKNSEQLLITQIYSDSKENYHQARRDIENNYLQ